MTVLVVGASGATGRLLVKQLLDSGTTVKIIVRSQHTLPDDLISHANLSVICAPILELSDTDLSQHVKGCDAVVSCLGHTPNLQGLYAPPRKLVTEATRRLCNAIAATTPSQPVKFILMNTAGNSNQDLHESVSFAQRCVVGLIRLLLPPHADNEAAADFLRVAIGQQHQAIKWVVVRPDTLTNEATVTPYDEHPSPTRSAIFNPGTTSRINVAHFMARLLTDIKTWHEWCGHMPVIYNQTAA
jgi:putative NADH-flavin reductase